MADEKHNADKTRKLEQLAVDLRGNKKLRAWLEKQTREVCVAIAARAALRVASTLSQLARKRLIPAEYRERLLLPVLRCMAAPWATVKYPSHDTVIFNLAAAYSVDTGIDYANDKAFLVVGYFYTASAASYAAEAAADDAYDAKAAKAANAAADAMKAASPVGTAARAFAIDAKFIDGGGSVTALIAQPLWQQGEPQWSKNWWPRLKAASPPKNTGTSGRAGGKPVATADQQSSRWRFSVSLATRRWARTSGNKSRR